MTCAEKLELRYMEDRSVMSVSDNEAAIGNFCVQRRIGGVSFTSSHVSMLSINDKKENDQFLDVVARILGFLTVTTSSSTPRTFHALLLPFHLSIEAPHVPRLTVIGICHKHSAHTFWSGKIKYINYTLWFTKKGTSNCRGLLIYNSVPCIWRKALSKATR